MPSPFPGMDPFIEHRGYWGDCHGNLVSVFEQELNLRLPNHYAASIDRYVWIHEPDAKQRRKRREPDVFVTQERNSQRRGLRSNVIDAPSTVILPAEPRRSAKFVKIEDMHSRRIVTVIELLSPSNKQPGEDREAYLTKRSEYLASNVNLVEIDLLRSGKRPPLGDPPPKRSDYYVLVLRHWESPEAGFWPIALNDPLPDVPVPLTSDEEDVVLPIQECFNRVYDGGRYPLKLRYFEPPTLPLPEKDRAWIKRTLAQHKSELRRN